MSSSQATCLLVYLLTCLLVHHVTMSSSQATCLLVYLLTCQLVNHVTLSSSQATCLLVYLLTCQLVNHIILSSSQATCLLVYLFTRQLEQHLLARKFWLHIDLTDTTIGTHDWLGIGETVPTVRGEGLLRGKLLSLLEDKVASVINR